MHIDLFLLSKLVFCLLIANTFWLDNELQHFSSEIQSLTLPSGSSLQVYTTSMAQKWLTLGDYQKANDYQSH